jgi:ATP-dependent DNA ligase
MKYESFRYIYPPRPKNAVSPEDLIKWEGMGMTAQLKFNGSNCLVFTNGERIIPMNRHGERITGFTLNTDQIKNLYQSATNVTGSWMVVNGEWMNKSKLDERGVSFNGNFVIFDILVKDSKYLVGKTFSERIEIMDKAWGVDESGDKDYLYTISDNIWRVKSIDLGFEGYFNKMSDIDMIEGLVLKRKNARLEIGNTENNNIKSQIKSRKKTKNYKY